MMAREDLDHQTKRGVTMMHGVKIMGRLKRIFAGPERAMKAGSRRKISPVRPGRGMPDAVCGDQGGDCMVSKASDRPAFWSQFGVETPGVARVFAVGSHTSDGRMTSLARDFSLRGHAVDFCDDFEESLMSIAISPRQWNLLVVDVDHVERALDIEDIVNDLVSFREQFSEVAIVLISHGFATDDSGLIRSSIADYCFRASVGNGAVLSALPHVFENHQSWIRRRKGLAGNRQTVDPFSTGEAQ